MLSKKTALVAGSVKIITFALITRLIRQEINSRAKRSLSGSSLRALLLLLKPPTTTACRGEN